MRTSTVPRPAAIIDRRSARAIDGFRIRLALGQRTDVEMAVRYRYAKLEAEVAERLRAL